MQGFCRDGCGAALTTFVKVVELTGEGVEAKRKDATLSKQNKDIDADPVKVRAIKSTVCEQFVGVERWIPTLKTQLGETQLEPEKLTDEYSKMKPDL